MQTESKASSSGHGSDRKRRKRSGLVHSRFSVQLLCGLLVVLASVTRADPAFAQALDRFPALFPHDSTARSAASSRPTMVLEANTWELVRETTHRLLEPDTRLLRYLSRYTVSPEIARKIVEESTAAGIDPELAFRLIRVESRFRPRARSSQGALGLTQVMPSTARALDRSLRTEAEILDPRTNLRLGLRYLRSMIDRYGDVRLGLLAYNRGPGTVDRALRQGRDPENGFSRRVLGTGSARYRGAGLIADTVAR